MSSDDDRPKIPPRRPVRVDPRSEDDGEVESRREIADRVEASVGTRAVTRTDPQPPVSRRTTGVARAETPRFRDPRADPTDDAVPSDPIPWSGHGASPRARTFEPASARATRGGATVPAIEPAITTLPSLDPDVASSMPTDDAFALPGFGPGDVLGATPLDGNPSATTLPGADVLAGPGARFDALTGAQPSTAATPNIDAPAIDPAREAEREASARGLESRTVAAEKRAAEAVARADALADKLATLERKYEELRRERATAVPVIAPIGGMRIGYERDASGELIRSDNLQLPSSASPGGGGASLVSSVSHAGSVGGAALKKPLWMALVGPKAVAVAMTCAAIAGNRQSIGAGAAWARNVPKVTQAEVTTESIAHFLQIDSVDRPLPNPKHFSAYLRKHSSTDDAKAWTDPWGKRYRLDAPPLPCAVRSAGPDGLFGTSDDIATPVFLAR